MENLETKILSALEHAVDDGDIYLRADGCAGFRLGGSGNFMETLIGLCTVEERSVLFTDWVFDGASHQLIADFFAQMIAQGKANYMTQHMMALAYRLLTHYENEVDQMLSAKARINPLEEDRTFDSDFNKVFKTGEAA